MRAGLPQLRPLEPQRLSLEPAEQANFGIVPESSRQYSFRTFGSSDTVMVLFEDDGGELRYISGDDDGGTDENASLRVRLLKDRSYVVRIRLYYRYASGDTLLMMW